MAEGAWVPRGDAAVVIGGVVVAEAYDVEVVPEVELVGGGTMAAVVPGDRPAEITLEGVRAALRLLRTSAGSSTPDPDYGPSLEDVRASVRRQLAAAAAGGLVDAATVRQLLAGDPVPGLVPGRRAHPSPDPARAMRQLWGDQSLREWREEGIAAAELRARVAAARARDDWGASVLGRLVEAEARRG